MSLYESVCRFSYFKAGGLEQRLDVAGRVFTAVTRGSLSLFIGTDVLMEQPRMIAQQDRPHGTQAANVRRGKHEMSAGPEDTIELRHHVHGVIVEVLDQFTAEHRGKRLVRVRVGVRARH